MKIDFNPKMRKMDWGLLVILIFLIGIAYATLYNSNLQIQGYNIAKLESKISQGTLCGMYIKDTIPGYVKCRGYNPLISCPPDYTRECRSLGGSNKFCTCVKD